MITVIRTLEMDVDGDRSILFVALKSRAKNGLDDIGLMRVVGSAKLFNPQSDDPMIGDLFVAEDSRGKGVGALIMQTIIDCADVEDKDLYLHVKADNWAMNWYQRLGFVGYDTKDDDPASVWMLRSQLDMLKQSAG